VGAVSAAGGEHGGDLLALAGDLGVLGLAGALLGVVAGQPAPDSPAS
jgi:hypothetical protein